MRLNALIAGLALLALGACANLDMGKKAPKPLLADAQVLGTVTMTRDTVTQDFTTYSFPTGNSNATAWFGHKDKTYYLNIRAFPKKDPNAKIGILSIVAILPDAPLTGMSSDQVTVRIVNRGTVDDKPIWSSVGHPAHLEILSLDPTVGSQPPTAKLTAKLSARICNLSAPPSQPDCLNLTGNVSTLVEYDYSSAPS